jgi:hypothetical protein
MPQETLSGQAAEQAQTSNESDVALPTPGATTMETAVMFLTEFAINVQLFEALAVFLLAGVGSAHQRIDTLQIGFVANSTKNLQQEGEISNIKQTISSLRSAISALGQVTSREMARRQGYSSTDEIVSSDDGSQYR